NKELVVEERYLCWLCWEGLERTYFELQKTPTKLDQLFWTPIEIKHTCALYFYQKGAVSQSLIRALKYDFKAPLGIYLGVHMATMLNAHPVRNVDAIIPVPIHPRKKFARGYNQSELLARGLAKEWGLPVLKKLVQKKKHNTSQTKNDRFGRWDNVQNMFKTQAEITQYKHVLIVDDVITTGATLAALSQAIKAAAPHVQISLLSFAFTK
ncbi:MAG: ComF family protein, partial [Sphingomonadales bacterium]